MKKLKMMWQLLLFALAIIHCSGMSATTEDATQRNRFASNIYYAVAEEWSTENVVISPASIQISMAVAYAGARGKTAEEMRNHLGLGSDNIDEMLNKFEAYHKSFRLNKAITYFDRFYINEALEFKKTFKMNAQRLGSDVEKADFHAVYNKRTAERINGEINTITQGRIKDVVDHTLLDAYTEGIIVNAISFSAPWLNAFKQGQTKKRTFHTMERSQVQLETMWTLNNFEYGEFSEIDAKVLRMPYKETEEFAMWIVLPNSRNGLPSLQQALREKNLIELVGSGLTSQKVEVYLPKFKISCGVNLKQPFDMLGVKEMFTRKGDFGNMYRMFVTHYINNATHKAYIDVAEDGQVAPIADGMVKRFFASNTRTFDASHPFVFAIQHGNYIIFMGHVVK